MTNEPEITDQEILDRLASWVVERRMTTPAILLLESHRPLSFLGSQALVVASPLVHFFEPFLQNLAGPGWSHGVYRRFTELLEDRDNVDRLVIAIERREQAERDRLRAEKAERKAARRAARAARRTRTPSPKDPAGPRETPGERA